MYQTPYALIALCIFSIGVLLHMKSVQPAIELLVAMIYYLVTDHFSLSIGTLAGSFYNYQIILSSVDCVVLLFTIYFNLKNIGIVVLTNTLIFLLYTQDFVVVNVAEQYICSYDIIVLLSLKYIKITANKNAVLLALIITLFILIKLI